MAKTFFFIKETVFLEFCFLYTPVYILLHIAKSQIHPLFQGSLELQAFSLVMLP